MDYLLTTMKVNFYQTGNLRSLSATAALLLFAGLAVPGRADDITPPDTRTLWSAQFQPEGIEWNTLGAQDRRVQKPVQYVAISAGSAAACVLDVTHADWREYGSLAVGLTSETQGRVPILFRERDPEGIECWVVPAEVDAGTQTIVIRLLPQPAGDLRPALPQRDGVFNPEGAGAIDMTFLAAPGEVRIHSLTLRSGDQ